ncbi:hypothetical protein E8E12_001252 [Didymella heteroderae]|uniref:Uncharacterized protein n=1 Tax=Didymella heteroderae TaxID=1769908 RepID=A0A9P4WFQ0_9PLEO|nr:hypothetical protein E8E12_001252 [Didymella heteroderae]
MSTSALHETPVATANSKTVVKPDPASQDSESRISLCDAQDSVLKIHEHLVDISRLACQTNDELAHQRSSYKQAYFSEHRKLLEMAAAHKALTDANQRLEQENGYLKQQLIPQYERDLKRQEKMNLEAQILAKGLETKLLVLEKVNSDEQQRHARALEAATGLLHTQIQKIKDLKKEIEQRPTACNATPSQIHTPSQPRRSGRLGNMTSVQASERTLRSRKSASSKVNAKK